MENFVADACMTFLLSIKLTQNPKYIFDKILEKHKQNDKKGLLNSSFQ